VALALVRRRPRAARANSGYYGGRAAPVQRSAMADKPRRTGALAR
jgi:hypothetical protein